MLAGSWEQAEGCLDRDSSLEGDLFSGQLCFLGTVDTLPCGDPEQRYLLPSLRVVTALQDRRIVRSVSSCLSWYMQKASSRHSCISLRVGSQNTLSMKVT